MNKNFMIINAILCLGVIFNSRSCDKNPKRITAIIHQCACDNPSIYNVFGQAAASQTPESCTLHYNMNTGLGYICHEGEIAGRVILSKDNLLDGMKNFANVTEEIESNGNYPLKQRLFMQKENNHGAPLFNIQRVIMNDDPIEKSESHTKKIDQELVHTSIKTNYAFFLGLLAGLGEAYLFYFMNSFAYNR